MSNDSTKNFPDPSAAPLSSNTASRNKIREKSILFCAKPLCLITLDFFRRSHERSIAKPIGKSWRHTFSSRWSNDQSSELRRDAYYRRRHLGSTEEPRRRAGRAAPRRRARRELHRHCRLLWPQRQRRIDRRGTLSVSERFGHRNKRGMESPRAESMDARCEL